VIAQHPGAVLHHRLLDVVEQLLDEEADRRLAGRAPTGAKFLWLLLIFFLYVLGAFIDYILHRGQRRW
jgi:hypothetical protein